MIKPLALGSHFGGAHQAIRTRPHQQHSDMNNIILIVNMAMDLEIRMEYQLKGYAIKLLRYSGYWCIYNKVKIISTHLQFGRFQIFQCFVPLHHGLVHGYVSSAVEPRSDQHCPYSVSRVRRWIETVKHSIPKKLAFFFETKMIER